MQTWFRCFCGFFFFWDRPFFCSFLPFVSKPTLVIFRSRLLHSQGKPLDFLSYCEHYLIIVFPLIWLPLLVMNLPVFSLSVMFSVSFLSSLYLHFFLPCTFFSFFSICLLCLRMSKQKHPQDPIRTDFGLFLDNFSESILLSLKRPNIDGGD